MGHSQNKFLDLFKEAVLRKFKLKTTECISGQTNKNSAKLFSENPLRRISTKPIFKEKFEMGDLRISLKDWCLIVEYECDKVSFVNIVKYWAFARGNLDKKQSQPLLLIIFSSWRSYGSHRDLVEWLKPIIENDQQNLNMIRIKQFDHGNDNILIRDSAIQDAIQWIESYLSPNQEL